MVDLWRQPDRELRRLLKGSAMNRAKLTGLRRNIAVALGNCDDPEATLALSEGSDGCPSTTDVMVAEHISWAMDRANRREEL
jgi:epoxyqueuosine reductase QueG